jgi:hypothetical protein
MYQNPPRYAPGPPPHEVMPRRPRRRLVPLLAFLAVFAGMFFGGSYLASQEPDVRMLPGIAFAEVEGRDVVLVPYERDGARGMFQLLTQDMFQVRLAAADAATGQVLWDTQLSDQLIWSASVLASGQRYTYLTTDSGLVIVSLADGSITARDDGVKGLGSDYLKAPAAYGYDAASRRVMAMNAGGKVLAIALDQAAATQVDTATAAAWSGQLSAEPTTASPPAPTSKEATIGTERIALRDLPFGVPGSMLVRTTAAGLEIPVGGTTFTDGSFVVDGTTAVGATTGHVLIEHRRSPNDNGLTLSMVDANNGQVTSSLPLESQVDRAVTGPNNLTAIAAREVLAIAQGDGHLIRVNIGATNFFGSPE